MERSLLERLYNVLEYLEVSPNAFAKRASLDPSHWNKMLKGEKNVTQKTLDKVVAAFPELNMKWLKTGEGDMLLSVVPPRPVAPSSETSISELIATINKQADIIKSQQETILELTRRLPKP